MESVKIGWKHTNWPKEVWRLMVRNTRIFFLFAAGIILYSCSDTDYELELIEIHGTLKQWEPLTLTFHQPGKQLESNQLSSSGNYLYGIFRRIDKETIVPGYFAGVHAIDPDMNYNNTWKINFTPDNYGIWTYQVILIEDLPASEEDLEKQIKNQDSRVYSDDFKIIPREGNHDSFRSPGFIQYSNDGFLIQNENEERYILNCISVNGDLLNQYVNFTEHYYNKSFPTDTLVDQSEISDDIKNPGLNGVKLSISDILSDLTSFDRSQADLDSINEIQRNLEKVYRHGFVTVFEIMDLTSEKDDVQSLDNKTLAYLREMIARFSHNTGLIWSIKTSGNLDTKKGLIKDITKLIRDMDPYDHTILITCGPDDVSLETFIGYPFIDGIIMDNSNQFPADKLFMIKNLSTQKGRKWILLENVQTSIQYTNVRDIIWSRTLSGNSGLIWTPESDLDNYMEFEAFNSNISFIKMVNSINSSYKIPYDAKMIRESQNTTEHFGMRFSDDFIIIYLSNDMSYHLDSLSPGSYSITWKNLSTDSIHDQLETSFSNSVNNLVLSSPDMDVPAHWLTIIQKNH
ncbi:DUF5060 domain-containing protein [Bacteroidota bacterium]